MDDNAFDDIVGDKLNETQSFPFDEAQWQAVASQLEEKKKRRLILWWYWGAGIAALVLIGLAYNNILLHQKINTLENHVEQFTRPEQKPQENTNKEIQVKPSVTIDDSPRAFSNDNESVPSKKIKKEISNVAEIAPELHVSNPVSIDKNLSLLTTTSIDKKVIDKKIDGNKSPENETKQSASIAVNNEISQTALKPTVKLSVATFLTSKESLLDRKDYELPQFSITKTKVKTKFGFKTFSTGFSVNAGWGLVNVRRNLSLFQNTANDDVLVSGSNNHTFGKDNSLISSSQKTNNFKWWNQIHFSKGLSIKTELGRKRINFDIQSFEPSIGITEQTNNGLDEFFSSSLASVNISSGQIFQTEWALGIGINYSPFQKWKIQPFVSLIPEWSWNVVRGETIADRNTSGDDSFIEVNSTKLHLRTLSNRLGIQTVLGNCILIQTEFGYNLPVKIINSSLLNRYQVGLNIGYIF